LKKLIRSQENSWPIILNFINFRNKRVLLLFLLLKKHTSPYNFLITNNKWKKKKTPHGLEYVLISQDEWV